MRNLFMNRTRREKYMVVLFLLAIVIIWGGSLADRAGAISREFETTGSLLQEQQIVLDNAEEIEARMRAGVENLDPERILNGSRLLSEIASIAQRHGLNPDITPPDTEEGEVFFFHLVRVTIRQADMASLMAFSDDIQRRAPYMGLEQLNLTPNRENPTQLAAVFRISSVELTQ